METTYREVIELAIPRGLFLIQSLMDEVEFDWNPETGNVTHMVIHLKQ